MSARDLFGTEVACLSLPEYDTDTFTFDQVLGIRTPQFYAPQLPASRD